jgi:hypothetical protein
MTPEKAAYIRSLTESGLKDFQLTALNRFANARRQFREARENLEEQRADLRFIDQVAKERELGNILEFPTAVEAPVVRKRRRRRG